MSKRTLVSSFTQTVKVEPDDEEPVSKRARSTQESDSRGSHDRDGERSLWSDVLGRCTSSWKAYGRNNLLDPLSVDKRFFLMEDFSTVAADMGLYILAGSRGCAASDVPYIHSKENVLWKQYIEMIENHFRLTLPPWAEGETNAGLVPDKEPFGGYKRGASDQDKYRIKTLILGVMREWRQACIEFKHKNNFAKLLLQEDDSMAADIFKACTRVEDFISMIVKFLSTQHQIGEGAYEALFAAFCATVGFHVSPGTWRTKLEQEIKGIPVVSRPSLRCHSQYMNTARLRTVGPFPRVKTPLVIMVKPKFYGTVPVDKSSGEGEWQDIEQVAGECFGDMLMEVLAGEAQSEDGILGMIVQGTRVNLLMLQMDHNYTEHIKNNGSDDPRHPNVKNRAKLFYSEGRDYMDKDDRKELLRLFWTFGRCFEQSFTEPQT